MITTSRTRARLRLLCLVQGVVLVLLARFFIGRGSTNALGPTAPGTQLVGAAPSDGADSDAGRRPAEVIHGVQSEMMKVVEDEERELASLSQEELTASGDEQPCQDLFDELQHHGYCAQMIRDGCLSPPARPARPARPPACPPAAIAHPAAVAPPHHPAPPRPPAPGPPRPRPPPPIAVLIPILVLHRRLGITVTQPSVSRTSARTPDTATSPAPSARRAITHRRWPGQA